MTVGAWTYQVRQDSFTGATTCSLRGRHVVYRRGVLIFSLGGRVDTAAALYRIDLGAALDPHADDLEIAAAGERLHADDLDNASAGLVRVPARRLLAARSVAIRATPKGPIATFPVDGLGAALAQEVQAGCSVDAAPQPPARGASGEAQAAGFAGGAGSGVR